MARTGRPKGQGPERLTVSFRLIKGLYREAQEAAHHERTTVTAEIEEFLTGWVQKARHKHNGGQPFTPPPEEEKS